MLRLTARRLRVAIALATVPALSSCGDPLGPADVAGTFALTAPYPVPSIALIQARVVADTFFIEPSGTALRRTWIEQSSTVGGPTTVSLQEGTFDVLVENRAIGFQWRCPDGVACAAAGVLLWYELDPVGRTMRPRGVPSVVYLRVDASPR